MRLLIGNFKGPEGKQGEKGNTGETGATGQRGSRWTSGTAVTGTSVVGTIFSGTGITDARLHDYYINPDTGNVYECTVEGTADVAEWTHIGNIKGPKGATGPAGSISDIEEQKPTYTEAAKLENISSGETIKVAFGKLKKAMAVLIAHYTQKATVSILGHVKFSDSAAITTAGEYALDAIEKNASVNGTLANLIAQINSNLSTEWAYATISSSNASGSVQWHRWGFICEVVIAANITMAESWVDVEIATNLPPARFGSGMRGIIQSQETGLAYGTTIDSSGRLVVRTDANPQSGWCRGGITYITAD